MNHSWRATAYTVEAPHAIGAITSTSHGDKWVAVVCERANSCRAHDLGTFGSVFDAQSAVEAKIEELSEEVTPDSDDPEHELGLNVKGLRDQLGWSQQELAYQMNGRGIRWHQTTVARVEKGERPLRLSEAAVLARIFGVDLQQMAAGVEMTGNSVIHQLTHRGRIRCGYTSHLPTAVHNGGHPVSCPSCLTGVAA
jgi:ribosome-binding protein aMBF1 (putative translation factor)